MERLIVIIFAASLGTGFYFWFSRMIHRPFLKDYVRSNLWLLHPNAICYWRTAMALVGLVLYFFLSPITNAAFQNFGAAMKNADLRFYAVEHFLMMLIAVVLVHIGRSKSKKAAQPRKKFGISLVFFGIAYIIMLAAIPWSRVIV